MKFIERLVVERMKGQVNIGVSLSCDILESLCRSTPGFERFFHARKISDAVEPHIGIDTTPNGPDVPLVSILYRNQHRNRSRCVTRRDVEGQRNITKRQLHTIRSDHVSFPL